ncbi:alpha-N-acetylgalactosaminide alpha-2,6-sialyltransferase 1 [Pangasianodon hypophthalmus]|uniref:alpha-N-acetylgalactosaminide alpha-2,6-sialyltransferase 1 n=1 Tax=Pangasianodon hypophthalmus TaxID=310915 RepID=UPI000EFDB82A|nr:alpha-N-acetylgalactosaminide alpha-2,6-sialyltransferase 1 [Pangasianodon hypophthalmus]
MQSQVVAASAFLFCCGLFYVLIWNKMPEKWPSFQAGNIPTRESDSFWRSGDEITGKFITTTGAPSLNLSSGKTTKGASEHHVPLNTSELKHQINITPIPILYIKNFTKLPKWDFEDVYMQSSEARRPVCSKSLQNSKDKEFQEAALWNIQLWLHNGHLNVSEWNRLAHFNNPFGFMEYTYTDIKKSVDLIPKPKYNQLLPVPSGSEDGCIRCAVVGTGGILNGSKMGKEIDSHDYVFRVNGAVTKGFEEDVGNKTSVYVHTAFSLSQSVIHLGKYGFKYSPQDEGIKHVMIPEGLRDYEWIEGLLEKKRMTYGSYKGYRPLTFYNDRFQEDKFYVLHPDFLRYIRNRFMPSENLKESYWALYRPTNGAFTLFLALHTCDIVHAYGFITADHSKYPNYYFETTKTRVVFYLNHDYNLEIKTWKKLHDAGIITLYQRQEN